MTGEERGPTAPPPPRDLLDAVDAVDTPPPPPPPPAPADGRPRDLLDHIDSTSATVTATGDDDTDSQDVLNETGATNVTDKVERSGEEAIAKSAETDTTEADVAVNAESAPLKVDPVQGPTAEVTSEVRTSVETAAETEAKTKAEKETKEETETKAETEMEAKAGEKAETETEYTAPSAEAAEAAAAESAPRAVSSGSLSEERDSDDAELEPQPAPPAEVPPADRDDSAESPPSAAEPSAQPPSPDEGGSPAEECETQTEIAEKQEIQEEERRAEITEGQEDVSEEQDSQLEEQSDAASEQKMEVCTESQSSSVESLREEEVSLPAEVEVSSTETSQESTSEATVVAPPQQPESVPVNGEHPLSETERAAAADAVAMPAPATASSAESSSSSSTSSVAASSSASSTASSTGPAAAVDDGRKHREQPNLRAVPTRSNLKRKSDGTTGDSAPKRPRRGIQFDGVTVFYFPRAQGFTCIPSQGGSTLGMADEHSHVERFTLTDHVNEQRMAHRELLTRLRVKQRKLQRLAPFQPSASSSEESDAGSEEGSDLSDSELDVDSYFFLRPVSTRQRRALLRASGVRKIEPMEKDECRDIRTSREFCGCACKVVCRPDNCQCAGAGIKCQVDRQNFPCGCTRDGCQNPSGRIEFNPSRVRSHFVETIMREQPPPPAPGPSGPGPGGAGAAGWASCGWQKTAGCAASPGQQYMAEQEFPNGGYAATGGGAAFAELSAPYQEDSSYSENSDGSSDGSYETAGAAVAAAPPPAYQPPQTQSHYSSFSFEGGLQNYGPLPGAAPPYQTAALSGYPQPYTVCQSYTASSHYPAPAPHYSYPFNKYPTSGPGPGGGGAPVASAAPPAAGYPPSCGYPSYPAAAGCSYEPAPPVYAAAGPYDPAACSYPAAAPAASFAGPPAAGAAAFPPEPAAPANTGAAAGDERKYTDLRSVPRPAGGQLESLADLLQDKFGGWAASGAGSGGPTVTSAASTAGTASYCGTPPSEDSGVDVDECAAKHAPPADENIGQIMKKTMVESVSA
ncbi:actin cytoskeleton-regulatory complex protein pan1-like [Amphibalanus amphitrite]|uniref:actin cytoskeleton-regulatory complex protein pan1-like n=1 Tax=Amphibalanus amphitrite TaxID=1232801 RepID=UPI001C91DBC9|nr:actin cytoskeleton-regulatory complex protein pan1-like [Amphibalanus amphitrite]